MFSFEAPCEKRSSARFLVCFCAILAPSIPKRIKVRTQTLDRTIWMNFCIELMLILSIFNHYYPFCNCAKLYVSRDQYFSGHEFLIMSVAGTIFLAFLYAFYYRRIYYEVLSEIELDQTCMDPWLLKRGNGQDTNLLAGYDLRSSISYRERNTC